MVAIVHLDQKGIEEHQDWMEQKVNKDNQVMLDRVVNQVWKEIEEHPDWMG